ncbi:hypothetical protein [Persicobacter diffluens]|uniref:Uncharacterized protein n=1 Tax=Persicobacter diffluens TaxID=981 RepID=A0AAN5AMZ1_9BACT|nr:hypothetical protein PEDI_34130 [Persicobacter diffluens]
MKSVKRIFLLLLWSSLLMMGSCMNPRLSTSAGVDVHWGPNGPQVRPHMNVGVYGGGRL